MPFLVFEILVVLLLLALWLTLRKTYEVIKSWAAYAAEVMAAGKTQFNPAEYQARLTSELGEHLAVIRLLLTHQSQISGGDVDSLAQASRKIDVLIEMVNQRKRELERIEAQEVREEKEWMKRDADMQASLRAGKAYSRWLRAMEKIKESTATEAQSREAIASRQNIRLLVCDDEEPILEVWEKIFRDAGYNVRVALRADEALKFAVDFLPHVALFGFIMPEINGFDLAVKSSSLIPLTKIVIMTQSESAEQDLLRELGSTFEVSSWCTAKDELLEKIDLWAKDARRHDSDDPLQGELEAGT